MNLLCCLGFHRWNKIMATGAVSLGPYVKYNVFGKPLEQEYEHKITEEHFICSKCKIYKVNIKQEI